MVNRKKETSNEESTALYDLQVIDSKIDKIKTIHSENYHWRFKI